MKLLIEGVVLFICYGVLVLQFYRASKKGYNSTVDVILKKGRLAVLNQRHLISAIAMAAAVLYVGLANDDGLLLALPNSKAVVVTIALCILACTISIRTARKALRQQQLPPHAVGDPKTYLLIRALFLALYELFFRAVLLSFCIAIAGVPVAILINLVLYAIAHAFSTRQELIGTIPFGLLLCGLTLFSRSIWPAVLIHLLLGLPYDVVVLSAPKSNTKPFLL